MASELRPDVVLVDLHMPGSAECSAAIIKSQLVLNSKHIVVMSIWDDESSQDLARMYGAGTLLDKNELRSSLIPTLLGLV